MNLIENEVSMQKAQNTKMIKIIGVLMIVLIIIAVILVSYLTYQKSKELKFIINGEKKAISTDLFYFDDNGDVYISIKDLSRILQTNKIKAEYNNGSYKLYNEDVTECNIEQEYEVAGYELNSNKMYKVVIEDGSYEYFSLDKPIKSINGKLYASEYGVEIGFNVLINFDKNSNSIKMNTIDYLIKDDSLMSSKEITFLNKKAIKYDMTIVKNANNEYGVKRRSTGEIIIGTKYTNLRFLESTLDFIVTTPEKKQGIISTIKGKDIEPQYAEIKKIKEDLNLYLIKNDKGKYGVYNREKQKTIIYPEYDSIGVEIDKFKNERIENQYILYDNCIPCKKSDNGVYKWELMDVNGQKIIDQKFDGIGYIKGTSEELKGDNLLLIPEIQSIIVNKDSKYGIINSTGKLLVKISLQQVYAETSAGKNTYYMVYNNQTFDVLESLQKSNTTTTTNTNKTENTETSTENNTNNTGVINNNANKINNTNTTNSSANSSNSTNTNTTNSTNSSNNLNKTNNT